MFLHRLVLVDRVDFSQRDIPVSFVQFTLYTFEFDSDILQCIEQHCPQLTPTSFAYGRLSFVLSRAVLP